MLDSAIDQAIIKVANTLQQQSGSKRSRRRRSRSEWSKASRELKQLNDSGDFEMAVKAFKDYYNSMPKMPKRRLDDERPFGGTPIDKLDDNSNKNNNSWGDKFVK